MKRNRLVTDAPGSKTKTYPIPKAKKPRAAPRTSAMTPGPCYFDGIQDEQVGECDGVPGPKDYCFGCKKWICPGHSQSDEVMGKGHDPYAHIGGGL